MIVHLSDCNAKRLEIMFPVEQHEYLVNECFENAFLDFLVFLESVDKEKLNAYYEAMEECLYEHAP